MKDHMDEIIRKHFRNGEKNHYTRAHIREVLIQKGYDPVRVQMVYGVCIFIISIIKKNG